MIIWKKSTTYEDILWYKYRVGVYSAHSAIEEGCDMILTIDVKHFSKLDENGAIEVMNPHAFLDKYL